ncbi:hypothetical protein [Anaerobacillus alkalilacustris]|nr:hypothetical protein [Anaerobacillus alkalilacustris]
MKKNHTGILIKRELQAVGNGYKVIKVEVSDSTKYLYAVCTPIKMQ